MADQPFTIGVEEEFFIVDAATRELRPRAEKVMDLARYGLGANVSLELHLAQIETSTPVCSSLPELRQELVRLRRALVETTEGGDSRMLPAGTHPFSEWLGQQITPKPRYEQLDTVYQQLAWEQLVCGCHVHVCVPDAELAGGLPRRRGRPRHHHDELRQDGLEPIEAEAQSPPVPHGRDCAKNVPHSPVQHCRAS